MKKLFLLICTLYFSGNIFGQVSSLEFVPSSADSINLRIRADFDRGPDFCENILGYDLSISGDTLYMEAYYRNRGMSTTGYGCMAIDTVYIGKWKELPATKVISVMSYHLDTVENKLDTNAMPPFKSIHRSLSVSSIDKQSSIKVFPNPATLLLSISSEQPVRSAIIQNIQGMILLKKQEDVESIDITPLSPGIYFLKLETSEGVFVKQFLKE